jgi:ribosomal-protein-alanine N-acetyltransferase
MGLIPELRTGRLRLRPFELADAPEAARLVGDARVAATAIAIPHPYPEGAAERWIATHEPDAAEGNALTWAVTDLESGTLYGAITLRVTPGHRRGEIGYWAGVPYWNRGITTEAARRVVEHAFLELDLHRVQAICLPENHGSARVMEKAGLRFEGTLSGYVLHGDSFEDCSIYATVRAEWDAARADGSVPNRVRPVEP